MKQMKKILALVLAAVMVMAMGSTAFAAQITIQSTADGDVTEGNETTYDWYQILVASISEEGEVDPVTGRVSDGTVSYYVEDETLASLLNETPVFTATRVGNTNHWNITLSADHTGTEIAAALNTDAIKAAAIASGQVSANGTANVVIDNLDDGYYLIVASNGTNLVVQTLGSVLINEKNTYPTIEKAIDKGNAEIGETVTYTLTVKIPESVAEKDIVLFDNFTDGLTMDTAITVTGAADSLASLTWANDTGYTGTGRTGYKTTIPAANVIANKGKTLTLTYTATLNENAVINENENNAAHLEYDHYTSKESAVDVTTFGFELKKVDKTNHDTTLEGVTFTLTNGDNNYYTLGTDDANVDEARFLEAENTVATDSKGMISFEGLHAGTYILTEIANPIAGYNMLTAPVTITVAENGKVTVADGATVQTETNVVIVENAKGSQLPSTGGVGTTVFYAVGSMLVLAAVVLLVTKRRMKDD